VGREGLLLKLSDDGVYWFQVKWHFIGLGMHYGVVDFVRKRV
jgi:hypothetical protein